MSQFTHDVCVGVKYKQGDQEKTKWTKVGAAFTSDKGISIKLEFIPIGSTGPVWLTLFAPKDKQQQQAPMDEGVPY